MFQIRQITDEGSKELDKVRNELYRFNQTKLESATYEPFNFVVYDENGTLIAGLLSHRFGEIVFLEILWVEEGKRAQGIGESLLGQLELTAKNAGAKLIHLDTYDFQAPAFYMKNGYETFGVLDNAPLRGMRRFFMKKDL